MDYRFLDPSDEALIEMSERPLAGGIAVAVRTTGFEAGRDEVLELAIVDMDGNELFSKVVKPQNVSEWTASEATGGIAPTDVEDAPELYQFEEEISEIFEKADFVVAAHLPFAETVIESSWVTLPAFEGVDVIDLFLQSHSTADAPTEPATAASIEDVARYYGIESAASTLVESARTAVACYRALVQEHGAERQAKGEDYWERYRQAKADEEARNRAGDEAMRKREQLLNRMNGMLWICGGLIFTSLIIQLYQRGGDMSLMVVFGIVAVFAFVRGVMNLLKK